VGVAGATIVVLQTSADSGDSSVVHPDSMVPLMDHGRPLFGDTIPHDSTWHPPVDTLLPPIDTLSPPPSHGCGDGHQVATAISDAQGHFTISGLGAGTYDLVALPPTGYWGSVSCYVDLRTRPSTDVQIFVAPRGDSVFHGLD
ncbi:MAG: carboxypeptidase-like regulatory domain-containing protein, partial [Gemmatimonadota bacterium]